jgi:hypothetical protein
MSVRMGNGTFDCGLLLNVVVHSAAMRDRDRALLVLDHAPLLACRRAPSDPKGSRATRQ